ncbi:hypothetical protein P3339_16165 [Microbulbifer sp. MLAF003]|uniref:hypothetical protein n=1 Tax=Microbulbifer sp. MLAF003 TaxID=3032582 RepID=UPI0024ADD8E3|nr:hypothetical protein [Microbulbifer sp. MLAF003]WHI49977.1 hypothetical protein P3339_16165 [Microbulbifer sp. MLAF003]
MNIKLLGYHSGFALCNALYIGSVTKEEELLVPFCCFFDAEQGVITPFEAESQALADQKARAAIAKEEKDWTGWCYAREGKVNLQGGGKSDAYVIEAKLKEMKQPLSLIQLFEYPFKPVSRLIVSAPNDFREVFANNLPAFREAFIQGARSHKLGGENWKEWESTVFTG